MPATDSYFNSKEFQGSLRRYEDALSKGAIPFFDLEELDDIAEYYYLHGMHEQAVQTINLSISRYPGATEPLTFRSRMALTIDHNVDLAERLIEQIDDKTDPDYHYAKAEILIVKNRIDSADEYLSNCKDEIEEDALEDFIIDVANLYLDYGLYEKAEDWMLLANDKSSIDYLELSGRMAMHQGRYDECREIFNNLIDYNPYSSTYWNQLASVQLIENKIQESITSSDFALAINPDDSDAILNKANAFFSIGNYEQANLYFKRFAQLCPNEECGEMYQGFCELYMDHPERAVPHLLTARKIVSDTDTLSLSEILRELAFSYLALSQSEEAMECVREILNMPGGDSAEAFVLKGQIHLQSQQWDEAKDAYGRAIEISGASPDIILQIAISFNDLKYYGQAYKLFQMLNMSNVPNRKDGYADEALCCYHLGLYEQFIHALKKACEINPTEAAAILSDLFPENIEPEEYFQYLAEGNSLAGYKL